MKKIIFISIALILIVGIALKPKKEMKANFLDSEFDQIEKNIAFRDILNKEVSKVSVAWHLDHTLLTINKIYDSLSVSNTANYKPKFNFGQLMMFSFNKIPRGRAQSPDVVSPPEIIVTDSIYLHLEEAKKNLKLLNSLPENANFTHPFIGQLNRKQTKRFLKIHTNHHLKIINDILKQQ